jgi:Tol biopolymer transport system component/DNA-binding SARP family transcriptional activator
VLRLNTFGRLFVERDGARLAGPASQPRRLALLALMAGSGDQGMTRDQLLGMLWSETDEERARKGLNQALYALRQELGADEVFLGTRDLRLNPDLVTSDVTTFTTAIKAGQLERATAQYVGPFLSGFHLSDAPEFERWLEDARTGLAHDYATALERLARRAAERGDPLEAVEWWRKLAAQDPLNARVAIGLMEALVANGDPTAALQHARVYEVLLQQELEAPPDRDVVALAERIRQKVAESPPAGPAFGSSVAAGYVATPAAVASPTADGVPTPETRAAPPPSPSSTTGPFPPPQPIAQPIPAPAAVAPQPRRAWRPAVLVGLVAVALFAGAGVLLRSPAPDIQLGRVSRLTAEPGLEIHPSLSPDGKLVAYAAGPAGQMRIYVRQLVGGRTIAVTDRLDGEQHWPRWSPDGTRLSFEMGGAIYVVPALGGAPKLLVSPQGAPSDEGPGYLAWSPDGRRIAYAVERDIYVREVGGTTATKIATLDQPHSLAWSPDGSQLAFVRGNAAFTYTRNAIGNIAPSSIWIMAASGGEPVRITDAASLNTSPVWLPGGRGLLFISDRDGGRDLYRVALDRTGHPSGAPSRLTTGLSLHGIDLSRDGSVLVYTGFTEFANIWSLPIPAHAVTFSAAGAQPLTAGHQSIEGLAISSDGRWLAFDSDRSGNQAIYRMPIEGGDPEPLSADSGDDFMPSWSPDARELAYYGFRQGRRQLFVMPVDGGPPAPVASDSGNQRFPDWSPDGRHLVFYSDRSGRFELYVVTRAPGGRWGAPRQLTRDGGQEARWSPDGRAIVYVRNAGLWVIPADGGPPRLLVESRNPAVQPVPLLGLWSPDGRTVYYKSLDATGHASIWSIPAEGGEPTLLVRFDDPTHPSPRAEFASDGKRFYFTIPERESDIWQMEVKTTVSGRH